MDAPQVVVRELGRGRHPELTWQPWGLIPVNTPRIAVLPRAVEALEDEEHAPRALGEEPLLESADPIDELGTTLSRRFLALQPERVLRGSGSEFRSCARADAYGVHIPPTLLSSGRELDLGGKLLRLRLGCQLEARARVEVGVGRDEPDERQCGGVDDPRDDVEKGEGRSVAKISSAPSSGPMVSATAALSPTSEAMRNQRPRTSCALLRSAATPPSPSSSTTGASRHQRTASQMATGIAKAVAVRTTQTTTKSATAPSSGRTRRNPIRYAVAASIERPPSISTSAQAQAA